MMGFLKRGSEGREVSFDGGMVGAVFVGAESRGGAHPLGDRP